MKRLKLVTPIYEKNTLSGVKLTEEGKRTLGRVNGNSARVVQSMPSNGKKNGQSDTVDFADVMRIVASLREKNPDYEITFDVKLR